MATGRGVLKSSVSSSFCSHGQPLPIDWAYLCRCGSYFADYSVLNLMVCGRCLIAFAVIRFGVEFPPRLDLWNND